MNLQEQIGALEAGVDQLLQAAAARASRTAGTAPADQSAAAPSDATGTEHANAVEPQASVAVAADAPADVLVSEIAHAPVVSEEAPEETVAVIEAEAPQAEPVEPESAPAAPVLEIARPAQNVITMTIGGQTVSLNPQELGHMIEELANARASMQPEPPPAIPQGWRFASTKNPMMAVQKQSSGDRLLVLRHTGHGWVPFTFSPDMVVQMYMMLTQR
jgi:hypothetical protein